MINERKLIARLAIRIASGHIAVRGMTVPPAKSISVVCCTVCSLAGFVIMLIKYLE